MRVEVRDAVSDETQASAEDPLLGLCDVIVTLPNPAFAMESRSRQTHLVPLCLPQAGTDSPEEPAGFVFDGQRLQPLHNQVRSAAVRAVELCALLALATPLTRGVCAVHCCLYQDHEGSGMIKLTLTLVNNTPKETTPSENRRSSVLSTPREHVTLAVRVHVCRVCLGCSCWW